MQAEAPAGQGVPPAPTPAPAEVNTISGQVAEKIDVEKYTYLRLTQAGGAEVWTAVPRSEVSVGDRVVVTSPQLMEDFASSTLKRTFPEIYFGELGTGAEQGIHGPDGQNAGLPPDHPATGMPPNHPSVEATPGSDDPHAQPDRAGDDVEVGKVARATGPNAHSVAELYASVDELVGKRIRLRATVVKVVPGVLDRTFLHVRDGTGDASQGTHDVTVTTQSTPAKGETILVEGTLGKDRDFGSGYRYPVILEDAQVVTE